MADVRPVTVQLPEELIALLGSPEAAAEKAKEALVLELLREGRITPNPDEGSHNGHGP